MIQYRKINLFEKILLPVGVAVTIFGFYLLMQADKLSTGADAYTRLTAIFTWLLLIFVMILAATNEDVKEELAELDKEQNLEIKLLKEIVHDQLQEIKLLRQEIGTVVVKKK